MSRAAALAGALLAATALLAGCGGQEAAKPAGPPAEPSAGTWRTWVLSSPSAIRVVPPPSARSAEGRVERERMAALRRARTAATAAKARRWSRDPALAPWMELAFELVSARPKDPPAASRAYGLLSVAMHDAVLAAWHWKYVYRRSGPRDPDPAARAGTEPSYPSEHAAIAGAAVRVLADAFPTYPEARLEALAAEAVDSRVRAGASFPSDVEAGLALGRRVGDLVVARAAGDRSTRRWLPGRPRGKGAWAPPPGSVARPVQPQAGRWSTWVLESGRELRPEPPPEYGSARYVEEAREVLEIDRRLTPERKRIAEYWAGGEGTPLPPGIWNQGLLAYVDRQDLSTPRATRVFALMNVGMADAGVAAWDAKYAYWTPRPENAIRDLGLDRDWTPHLDTPFFPAYVSGHATYSGATGEVLAHLFPVDADFFRAKAREAAMSRMYGGIHFRADSEVGLRIGREIGRRVVRWAARDEARE